MCARYRCFHSGWRSIIRSLAILAGVLAATQAAVWALLHKWPLHAGGFGVILLFSCWELCFRKGLIPRDSLDLHFVTANAVVRLRYFVDPSYVSLASLRVEQHHEGRGPGWLFRDENGRCIVFGNDSDVVHEILQATGVRDSERERAI